MDYICSSVANGIARLIISEISIQLQHQGDVYWSETAMFWNQIFFVAFVFWQ